MASQNALIPEPRSVEWLPGSFAWRTGLCIACHPEAKREAERLAAWLTDCHGLQLLLSEDPVLPPYSMIVARRAEPFPPPGGADMRPEGYMLHIAEDRITIMGADLSGLFYGVQTLRQLDKGGQQVPAVRIEDWPGLEIRGLHLDLKGCTPTFAYLCEIVALLARHKINTLLIEYEDKFPYERHAALRSPEALTPDELKTFLDLCRDHHIQTIPLLQSLGHVEYILRHDEYAHLREAGGLGQLCPLHPGSRALFQELLAEVLAYHPDATYVHIGADECRDLGKCMCCREAAARRGKAALYIDHLNTCLRHVQSLGLTPIFWADMIRNECVPEIMDLVQPGAVPCDWLHDVTADEVPFVYWGGGERISSRRWLEIDPTKASSRDGRFIEDFSEDQVRIMRKYWDRGRFPLWNDSLPLLKLLAERKAPFLGAGAAKGGTSPNRFYPEWREVFGNLTLWARRAVEAGLLGVISTAWSRWNSLFNPSEPFEYSWYTILTSADYYWYPRPADRAEFDRRFAEVFLGLPDERATRAMRALENTGSAPAAMQLLEPIQGQGSRPLHLAYLLTAAKVAAYQEEARAFLGELDGRVYQFEQGGTPAPERAALTRGLETLMKRQTELAVEFEAALALTLKPADAHEVVQAQLRSLARRLRDYLSLLQACGNA